MLTLWKLFGLLSFGFSFGSWFGREMEWENCFLVMLCNQKEACSLLRLGEGYLIVFVSFEESVLRCLLR